MATGKGFLTILMTLSRNYFWCVTYLGVCAEVQTQAQRARRGRQTTMGEPWVGYVCGWWACNVMVKVIKQCISGLFFISRLADGLLLRLLPSPSLLSSPSCPTSHPITSSTLHTQAQATQPGQGGRQGALAGLGHRRAAFKRPHPLSLLNFSMAAQSGFCVAKPSTSTTQPTTQDALQRGEGHAGPAARPRGGERAAL